MKPILTLSILLQAFAGLALAEQPAIKCCKMDEVHVGMKGVGKTVMNGSQIQEFQCEVIGVLKKVFPDQDIIIAKLSGLGLEKSGVIEGMSGSPVYVDGKLLGAVAYAWAFSKDPICGITPAEKMTTLISDINGAGAVKLPLSTMNTMPRFGGPETALSMKAPAGKAAQAGGSRSFTRMRAPVVISGCPSSAFERVSKRLGQMGMLAVQGGGNAADAGGAADMQAGSPLAIPFVNGDLTIAGIGTLTERVGDDFIGFGHPMMEMGRAEMPVATAEINAVIPSTEISFKIGSVGKTIGTLLLDRTEGICGRIGPVPHLVPLTVKVNREDFQGTTTHHYELASHPAVTPFLLDICLYSSMSVKGGLPQDYTMDYTVRLVTEDNRALAIHEKVTSQDFGAWSFISAAADTAYMLMNNPFKSVPLKEVTAEMSLQMGAQAASIDSLSLANVKVAPGKTAKLAVRLLPFRKQYETVDLEVPIPEDMPEGLYDVVVSDSSGARYADRSESPALFEPTNYDEMLRTLQIQYANEDLYVRISMPGTGLSVRGKTLPNLPASFLSVMTPVGRSRTDFVGKIVKASKPTAYQITGSERVQLLVEKED